jgi:hypothetical protein
MKQVEELIRGEISAIESFDVVMKKLDDAQEKQHLSTIREDHVNALNTLKRYSGNEFKAGVQDSGPWGSFTKSFAGGASLFGDKAALRALKIGEEHGRSEYKELLNDKSIDQSLREVITTELLPAQERHIQTIDGYLQ